jgi:hypothetical protein
METKIDNAEITRSGRKRALPSCCLGCSIALVIFLGLWSIPILNPTFDQWSALCNEDQYTDLNTGRHRVVRHLFGMTISDRVSEGLLARLYKKYFGAFPSPCWEMVNTFSYWSPNISPHYPYHSMNYVERKAGELLDTHACADGFKRLLVAEILWSAKEAPGDSPVSMMMWELEERFKNVDNQKLLTESDFPADSSFFMVGFLAAENPKLTPRAYGIDRFPELMQKISPPY